MCETVLQHKGRHAFRGQVLSDVDAFAVDGEGHKTAARVNHHSSAVSQFRRWLEYGQRRFGYVSDDFGVPAFREVLFLRIVVLRRAGRGSGVEGNDVLGGSKRSQEYHQAKVTKEESFHGRIV